MADPIGVVSVIFLLVNEINVAIGKTKRSKRRLRHLCERIKWFADKFAEIERTKALKEADMKVLIDFKNLLEDIRAFAEDLESEQWISRFWRASCVEDAIDDLNARLEDARNDLIFIFTTDTPLPRSWAKGDEADVYEMLQTVKEADEQMLRKELRHLNVTKDDLVAALERKLHESTLRSQNVDWRENLVQSVSSTVLRPEDFRPSLVRLSKDRYPSLVVGEGTFGIVFKSQWRGEMVAVKLLKMQGLSQRALAQLSEEMRIMFSLGANKNVINVYGLIAEPLCLVMSYAARGSLRQVLDSVQTDGYQQTQQQQIRWKWAQEIANGMAWLHSATPPIIHRDLKSDNILVDEDGRLLVSDFGCAVAKSETLSCATQNTVPSIVAGSVPWMAPEAFSTGQQGAEGDVYAFAIVMWEIFTRDIPWSGIHPALIPSLVQGGQRPPVPKPDSSSMVDYLALMSECWDGEANRRPPFVHIKSRSLSESLKTPSAPKPIVTPARLRSYASGLLKGAHEKATKALGTSAACVTPTGIATGPGVSFDAVPMADLASGHGSSSVGLAVDVSDTADLESANEPVIATPTPGHTSDVFSRALRLRTATESDCSLDSSVISSPPALLPFAGTPLNLNALVSPSSLSVNATTPALLSAPSTRRIGVRFASTATPGAHPSIARTPHSRLSVRPSLTPHPRVEASKPSVRINSIIATNVAGVCEWLEKAGALDLAEVSLRVHTTNDEIARTLLDGTVVESKSDVLLRRLNSTATLTQYKSEQICIVVTALKYYLIKMRECLTTPPLYHTLVSLGLAHADSDETLARDLGDVYTRIPEPNLSAFKSLLRFLGNVRAVPSEQLAAEWAPILFRHPAQIGSSSSGIFKASSSNGGMGRGSGGSAGAGTSDAAVQLKVLARVCRVSIERSDTLFESISQQAADPQRPTRRLLQSSSSSTSFSSASSSFRKRLTRPFSSGLQGFVRVFPPQATTSSTSSSLSSLSMPFSASSSSLLSGKTDMGDIAEDFSGESADRNTIVGLDPVSKAKLTEEDVYAWDGSICFQSVATQNFYYKMLEAGYKLVDGNFVEATDMERVWALRSAKGDFGIVGGASRNRTVQLDVDIRCDGKHVFHCAIEDYKDSLTYFTRPKGINVSLQLLAGNQIIGAEMRFTLSTGSNPSLCFPFQVPRIIQDTLGATALPGLPPRASSQQHRLRIVLESLHSRRRFVVKARLDRPAIPKHKAELDVARRESILLMDASGGEEFVVEFEKDAFGLGVSVMWSPEENAVVVKTVEPDGAAARSCKIAKGDIVCAVQGVRIEGLDYREVGKMLRQIPLVAVLVLKRPSAMA